MPLSFERIKNNQKFRDIFVQRLVPCTICKLQEKKTALENAELTANNIFWPPAKKSNMRACLILTVRKPLTTRNNASV